MFIDTTVTLFDESIAIVREFCNGLISHLCTQTTALTKFFVSVASEIHIREASRTIRALRRLTIGLHLFTYSFRIST